MLWVKFGLRSNCQTNAVVKCSKHLTQSVLIFVRFSISCEVHLCFHLILDMNVSLGYLHCNRLNAVISFLPLAFC